MPGEGEGSAAKLGISGSGEGGVVHAGDAAQERAVEDFSCSCGLGGAWGERPDLTSIGKDRGD